MLKNYIIIAWRSLWKNKSIAGINIISLAIGISASMVIGMLVYYEFTFDKFHDKGERIYRVTTEFKERDGLGYSTGTPVPLTAEIRNNYSGVETVAFIATSRPYTVELEDGTKIKEPTAVTYADQRYFDIFSYEWLAGSAQSQLTGPNEVVLTEARAQEYFPNLSAQQVIGKSLVYNDSITTTVTGVVANFKQRTDLVFQEFISLKTSRMRQQMEPKWTNTDSSNQILVLLDEENKAGLLQQQLTQTALDHQDKELNEKYGVSHTFYAQPFLDMHFSPDYAGFDGTVSTASKPILLMLSFIALFLLLLGCVNFINLNTAYATQRSREIGIRKTLGSSKKQLIGQFMGETLLLSIGAALLSLVLTVILLRVFNDFLPADIDLSLLMEPVLIAGIIILIAVVTFTAGIYPSLVLSKFKPARVLKGDNTAITGKNGLRKFLTVFQFTVAYIFIIGTLLVGKQIKFLLDKDLGFRTNSIVYISTPQQVEGYESRLLLAEKIKNFSQVSDVSVGGGTPVKVSYITKFTYKDKIDEHNAEVKIVFGDSKFLDLYEIPLVAGRVPRNDTIKEVVINEKLMEELGFTSPTDALNKVVNPDRSGFTITGVMQNFQNGSLKDELSPMALTGDVYRKYFTSFNTVHVKINTTSSASLKQALQNIETAYKEVYPNGTFKASFMDETVAAFYEKEQSLSKLLNWAMGLSVLISCLGLLGLVVFSTQRRIKEIGVRKVLGATVTQITVMLCRDFVVLIGLAFLIAAPIAYYFASNWLQDFANQTALSWWVFAVSGAGMLLLALIVTSFKTIAAALQNPVNNLKVE